MIRERELKWSKLKANSNTNQSTTRSRLKIEYIVKRECSTESKVVLKWTVMTFIVKRKCETKLVVVRGHEKIYLVESKIKFFAWPSAAAGTAKPAPIITPINPCACLFVPPTTLKKSSIAPGNHKSVLEKPCSYLCISLN